VTPSPSRAAGREEKKPVPVAAAPTPAEDRPEPRRAAEAPPRAEPPQTFENVPLATLDRRRPPPEPPHVEMPAEHLAELDVEPSPVPTIRPQRAVAPPPPLAPRAPWRIVLDPGHGGNDPGARGVDGILEKDVTLAIAAMLKTRLEKELNATVLLTRDGDATRTLAERTAFANASRADLFISIHANAARNGNARGSETYFMSLEASDDHARGVALRENESFAARPGASGAEADPLVAILGDLIANEHLTESSAFARAAQLRLARLDNGPSRGVKQAPFVVLAGVQMPAVLVEIGFITHAAEERELRSDRRRAAISSGLAEAVLEHGRRHDAQHGMVPAAGADR
jgi:N-acetylmuramoyl-L-alanine amidase